MSTPSKKLKKPTKSYRPKPAYRYEEIVDYIEAKYKVTLRGYPNYKRGEKNDYPYRDFWHFLCEEAEMADGGYQYIPLDYFEYDTATPENQWVAEILEMFKTEFPELANDPVWVSW